MIWMPSSIHRKHIARIAFVFTLVAFSFGLTFSLTATQAIVGGVENFEIEPIQSRIYSAINRATPAVVAVVDNGTTFSGVIISSEGHVASAGHTVTPGEKYKVILADGRVLAATGLGSTRRIDCALIKIDGQFGLPHAELANSSRIVVDQPCLSISHPGIYDAGRGAVVRFGHIVNPISSNQGMVQSTALMEPGDSGGGLFDLDGKLIAVHSNIGESLRRNFDVPANTFRKYWSQLNTAEKFTIEGIPSLPKLGIDVDRNDDGDGLVVVSVVQNSVAQKSGVEVDDIVLKLNGRETNSKYRFRSVLTDARSKTDKKLSMTVRRGERECDFKIPLKLLESQRQPITGLAISPSSATQSIAALRDLGEVFQDLESKLDDACVKIESELGNDRISIMGTLVENSQLIVSKNSRVGEKPAITIDGEEVELRVIVRDASNDLVLLETPTKNKGGINLAQPDALLPTRGRFLISPHPSRDGKVSVWGSRVFSAAKRESKGFLGVMLGTTDEGGAVLERVFRGGAREAGLKRGDVIKKIDEVIIQDRRQLQQYLKTKEPSNKVVASVLRKGKTIEREIRLGSAPSTVNHVAERMKKSERRDGFTQIFSHDANLRPRECGGPVFDLSGNFVGINIARFSRTRCYTIPKSMIVNFVLQNAPGF